MVMKRLADWMKDMKGQRKERNKKPYNVLEFKPVEKKVDTTPDPRYDPILFRRRK